MAFGIQEPEGEAVDRILQPVPSILHPCANVCSVRRRETMALELLDREVYGVGEAARLLGLTTQTAHRWLDGYSFRGKTYRPVVRIEPTGSDIVTWGEFVELGFLREYRKKDVPLQRLRPAIDRLRDEFGVVHVLAHARPWIDENRHLVLEIERETDLDPRLYMVVDQGGQLILSPSALAYWEKVEWIGEGAARFKPAGPTSKVVIDPKVAFGAPQVRGIRTEAIVELFLAREPMELIAEGFEMEVRDVEEAIRYEVGRLSPAA